MSVDSDVPAAAPSAPPHLVLTPTDAAGAELKALFAAFGTSCYGLARSILRDADMAQDVVQEAFLDHWRSQRFDAARATQRSWLLMLTHRKSVDRVRYEQRRTYSRLERTPEQPTTEPAPEDLAMMSLLAPKVRAALAELPQVQRRTLVLAYWGGYTQAEISKITHAPLGTVKTRSRNGLIALRRTLGDELGTDFT